MGQIFVIKDITADYELYDASGRFVRDIEKHFGDYSFPFLEEADFDPPNGEHWHIISGQQLALEADSFVKLLSKLQQDIQLGGFTKEHAIDFFQRMASYATARPDHKFTCYIYP